MAGGVGGRADIDGESETIEELRTEFSLLRIHRRHEYETSGMNVGKPVTLDAIPARHRHVEPGSFHGRRRPSPWAQAKSAPVGHRC